MKDKTQYLIGMDSETGGLSPNDADILTLYMCVINENGQVVEDLDLKLKPDNRLPIAHADALRITGIDLQKHLADPETITYAESRDRILELLRKYRVKGKYSNLRVFGYNVRFDVGFIQKYLLPQVEWEQLVHYKPIDVMDRIDFLRDEGWIPKEVARLESVVDFFGLPKGRAHTAKDDTLMTLAVHKKLSELMLSKKEGGSGQDLIGLLEAE